MAKAVALIPLLLALLPPPAAALRPFVGTDAAVAGPGELEVEFGYLSYLREGSEKSVIAPGAVVNFGLDHDNELVLEGILRNRTNPEPGLRRSTFEDGAISLKHVLRNGSLQGGPGPSVATECGALIPSLSGERLGAACAAIVSQQWGQTSAHLNAALARNRDSNNERFLGLILAAPKVQRVQPVFETFFVRDSAGHATNSALAGLLYSVSDRLTLDIALRKGRSDGSNVTEIRAGFTWYAPAR